MVFRISGRRTKGFRNYVIDGKAPLDDRLRKEEIYRRREGHTHAFIKCVGFLLDTGVKADIISRVIGHISYLNIKIAQNHRIVNSFLS